MNPQRRWTVWHVLGALALVGATVFAGWDAWRDIWNYGVHDEESSQIMLVPIVVAWIVWVRREALRDCRPVGRLPGLLMVGLGWFLMSMGNRHRIPSAWQGGAVMLSTGALLVVVGQQVFWKLLPAFGALVFLVPVPATGRHLIAYPLQIVTARATQTTAEVLGMAVERTGNLLSINGNQVAIAEACNGMRMVFTLFLVCYTFAFTTKLPWYVRVLVLVCSPLVAVLCNVIRLVPTVYVFGHYSNDVAERFHDGAGWVMLVVGYLLLMGGVRLIGWIVSPTEKGRDVVVVRGVAEARS
jgi:exosortase